MKCFEMWTKKQAKSSMNRKNGKKKASKLYNSYKDSSSKNMKDKNKHVGKHNSRNINNQILIKKR